MAAQEEWKTIVANSLGWEEAHASLETAIAGLPADLRAKKPTALPHSVWDSRRARPCIIHTGEIVTVRRLLGAWPPKLPGLPQVV